MISTAVTNVSVGTVTIHNAGVLQINNSSVTMQVNGDWINTATQLMSSGTVVFAGTIPQYIRNNGQTFKNITSSNTASGGLIFTSSFTCSTFTVNTAGLSSAATIYFAAKSTFTISTFTVTGTASYPVVLRSTASAVWYLNNTSTNSVSYVDVAFSSASVGKTIVDSIGVNSGNNTNWSFVYPDTGVRYWVASAPGNWSNSSNWSLISGGPNGASVPTSANTVVFDGGSVQVSSADVAFSGTVASMTVTSAYTGNIYLSTNFVVTTDLTISSGTIYTSKDVVSTITVGGNLNVGTNGTIIVRRSSTVGNGAGQLITASSMTINGIVNADGQGFDSSSGPGAGTGGHIGGTYGGTGGANTTATYGSFSNP